MTASVLEKCIWCSLDLITHKSPIIMAMRVEGDYLVNAVKSVLGEREFKG